MQIVSGEVRRRLSRLVRSMLDIAAACRPWDVGASRARRASTSARQLSDVLITFEQKINAQASATCSVDLPDKPVWTQADRDAITQVIYNLHGQRHQVLPRGRQPRSGARARTGRRRACRVRNTGPTIPAEELPLLFDRFHKADKARSADREGWGLGLYIAKTIVGAHGGEIWATSENGVTEFCFTLPVVR